MCKTSRMCKNSIWDLINSTINRRDERDVQTTGGMRGMCKRLFFLFFMFMKQSLCLGAWWPEGRSSSSVSQSLPSCSWSACQMAVNGKDGYRGDLSLLSLSSRFKSNIPFEKSLLCCPLDFINYFFSITSCFLLMYWGQLNKPNHYVKTVS